MTLVRIIKNWSNPDILRQTPQNAGIWEGIKFTVDAVAEPDYVIVSNYVPEKTVVRCAPDRIWGLMQEPPDGWWAKVHKGSKEMARIYTSDTKLVGRRYYYSPPYVPWHVDKSYDQLSIEAMPAKAGNISWITSNSINFKGHKRRMTFLEGIRGRISFDLFGKGFSPIEDKWDALAPYKYSLAVENYQNDWYWTEKIADCFLAWTMPIYYGCKRINDFFPKESMLQIDIDDPDAPLKIEQTIKNREWEKNLDAITYSRELVLNKYQFFPFLCEKIVEHEQTRQGYDSIRDDIVLDRFTAKTCSFSKRVIGIKRKLLGRKAGRRP